MGRELLEMTINVEVFDVEPSKVLHVVSICVDKLVEQEVQNLLVISQWSPREENEHVPLSCMLPDQSFVSD